MQPPDPFCIPKSDSLAHFRESTVTFWRGETFDLSDAALHEKPLGFLLSAGGPCSLRVEAISRGVMSMSQKCFGAFSVKDCWIIDPPTLANWQPARFGTNLQQA